MLQYFDTEYEKVLRILLVGFHSPPQKKGEHEVSLHKERKPWGEITPPVQWNYVLVAELLNT